MAIAHLESPMEKTIQSLVKKTKELQAANGKQYEEIQKLREEKVEKAIKMERLADIINDQGQMLEWAKLENRILRRQHEKCCYNKRQLSSQQKPISPIMARIIRLLIRTGRCCGFGCFFGAGAENE